MPAEVTWRTSSYPAGGSPNDPADDLGIEIHHTATDDGAGPTGGADNEAELVKLCRSIWRYHVQTKGWADIFYGFIVARDGSFAVGRGYHKGTSNGHKWCTIALAGNYDQYDATPAQLATVAHIRKMAGTVGVGDKVRGHGDRDNTACPGAGGRKLISDLVAGGGTHPDPAPSPPATQPAPAGADITVRWRTLDRGTRGRLVTNVQALLAHSFGQAGTVGAVDGIYGAKTAEAVSQVQRFFGAEVDGIVGPNTAGILLTDWEAVS